MRPEICVTIRYPYSRTKGLSSQISQSDQIWCDCHFEAKRGWKSYGMRQASSNRAVVPARQAPLAGEIDSLESFSGHHKSLKIPSLAAE
jgi:hypothetical protein